MVFAPAALLRAFIATGRELLPVIVNLFLRLALDLERDGLSEGNLRTAIKGGKRLPIQFNGYGHDRTHWFAVDLLPRFPRASHIHNLGMFEDRGIKRDYLCGVILKPQTGGIFCMTAIVLLRSSLFLSLQR